MTVTYYSESPIAFMAIKFKGDEDWAETGCDFAPAETEAPPDILKEDELGLYTQDTNGNEPVPLWYKPVEGVWSDVRDLAAGASLKYSGPKGSGVPEVGGRPDHENKAWIKKMPDKVSPKLFEICNTGEQLENLVFYHPSWNFVLSYEGVNVTAFALEAGTDSRWYLSDLTGYAHMSGGQVLKQWKGKGKITRNAHESIENAYETVNLLYNSLTVAVKNIGKGWDVETSSSI